MAIRSPVEGNLHQFVYSCISPIQYDVTAQTTPGITYIGGVKLDGLDVFRYEGIGMRRVRRTFRHIQGDQLDDVLICMPVHARACLSHYGTPLGIEPGSFMMYPASRPIECSVHSGRAGDQFSCIHVRVSGSLLRRRLPHLDDCCDRNIAIRPGATQIMRSLLDLALTDASALSHSQAQQFGSMLVDAIASAAGEAPEVAQALDTPRQDSHTRIFDLATRYIESNLSNPALDCELVAQHCRISTRYLRAVFASLSTTVNTFIREMRLQQCRASLQAPVLRDRTITQIAIGWGFNDPAHFSRIYKARFSRSPGEDRIPLTRFDGTPMARRSYS
jgi:AraC-like DNA-binding protein